MRVLVIEPDKILARSYLHALKQAGHEVVCEPQVQKALDILDKQSTDVIVLELQLAEHNGAEFLHEVRSYPEWEHIPVILHTMVPPSNLVVSPAFWQRLGVSNYLYKPQTTLRQLLYAVDRAVPVRSP